MRTTSISSRLTYSNVVATLALFLVLTGGSAYAARTLIDGSNLKNRSVTGSKLSNNAVTGRKVKNGSLAAADLSSSARRTLKGAVGAKGAVGEKGDKGDKGADGTEIAPGGITSTMLANGSVTSAKIQDGAVSPSKLQVVTAGIRPSSDVAVPDGSQAILPFAAAQWNEGGLFSDSTPNRFTISTKGLYQLTANIAWQDGGTGNRGVFWMDQYSMIRASDSRVVSDGADVIWRQSMSAVLCLSANDTLRIFVENTGTGGTVASNASHASITLLAPVATCYP